MSALKLDFLGQSGLPLEVHGRNMEGPASSVRFPELDLLGTEIANKPAREVSGWDSKKGQERKRLGSTTRLLEAQVWEVSA